MHDLSIRKLKVTNSRVTLCYEPYRKWSIKRRGAYLMIPVIGVALVRERRLFQVGVNTEGNIERIKWGVYKVCTIQYKVHLE